MPANTITPSDTFEPPAVEQALGLRRPEGVEQRDRREHDRGDPRDRERMRSVHAERGAHRMAADLPSRVQVHASKSVAVRGRPPGPLYAMPYIGSWSNAIAGTLARAVCHASMSRSSAS